MLAHCEFRNILSADVVGFWRPRPAFLNAFILRVPTRGVKDYIFQIKGTVMRAGAHLKPATQAKPFSGIKIIQVNYQNYF